MRKCVLLCCFVLLCSLVAGSASFAAAPDRGESLRSRANADDAREGLIVWRSHSRMQRELIRLLVGLPFALPPDPLERDEQGPIREGLGLSDDPDPTGSRGEDDDEQGGAGPNGDRQPESDEESRIRQIGMS